MGIFVKQQLVDRQIVTGDLHIRRQVLTHAAGHTLVIGHAFYISNVTVMPECAVSTMIGSW